MRWLLVAFFKSTPWILSDSRSIIRFSFCLAFSLPVAHQRKSVHLRCTNKKNHAVPISGTAWNIEIIPDMKDTDFGNSLRPGTMPANGGNQLRHMQNVRHGCHLASI